MHSVSPIFTRSQWRSHTISDSRTLWVIGDPNCDGQLAKIIHDGGPLAEGLRSITGHFSAIVVGPEVTVLIEDPIRSFPLFYRIGDEEVTVSDDALALADTGSDYVADYDSRIEFRHAAYVAGNRTLYARVYQVQAGELVTIGPAGAINQTLYRRIQYSGLHIAETAAVDAHFTAALDATMSRFLARADGRQIVVPLSGGLDSRLLSVYLKEAGYQNMVNFTYGTARTREVQISEQVSRALGQKWLFCPYQEETVRSLWGAQETADFIKFTHAGASLPHIQDWLAVRWLKHEQLIDHDAIFLPGHTIVGNMHDEGILDADNVSREEIKGLILRHHYMLQPENGVVFKNARLLETVDTFLDHIAYDGSVVSRLTALEYWNVRERQTKYINNSVRNYEFFGYDWALPMLDREVYLAWGDLHPIITRNRDWYEGYVNRRYASATGEEIGVFTPTDIPQSTREAIKRVLRTVGLLGMVERAIAAKSVENHPMGFNWFVSTKTPKELHKFTRNGGNLLGAYADEFLTDTWNSHCHLFTPADSSN